LTTHPKAKVFTGSAQKQALSPDHVRVRPKTKFRSDVLRPDITEQIKVTCLPKAETAASEWRARLVLSLLDPDLPQSAHPMIAHCHHHVFLFHDQERPEATGHFAQTLRPVLETVAEHLESGEPRLLIHCHAGVSRSTALAYGAISMLLGPGLEKMAFEGLLQITRKPWPNRRVVECLDNMLGRNGALLAPLDAMRAEFPMRIEHYRRFNRRRGLVSGRQR
jgi:predicted protein tyrosine phosphatase